LDGCFYLTTHSNQTARCEIVKTTSRTNSRLFSFEINANGFDENFAVLIIVRILHDRTRFTFSVFRLRK